MSPVIDKPPKAAQTHDRKHRSPDEVMSTSPESPDLQIDPKIICEDVHFYYGDKQALFKINLVIPKHKITAFIGPSGCGKSTLLRCLNRLNDLVEGARVDGRILMDGENIYDPSVDITDLRTKVGMVFQKVNPFPKSIHQNVAYGPQLHGVRKRNQLDEIVEKSLVGAGLWDEVGL